MADTAHELNTNEKTAIVEGLHNALADTSVTTMKAQFYHWNVTGPEFGSLHALFEEIYGDHFAGQDDIAERIRALGDYSEGSYKQFLERSNIEEATKVLPALEMVEDLAKAQETVAAGLRELADLATEQRDPLTEDLAIERGRIHEKFAWMLRAHLT
ncbi:DNA starvation/stationary phase protection protein [Roseobacter sp. HKCCA0434]|uniref:Dps family protein n=1 Tax=Roseobacter sp. HKCCA0434 TaxID=3079297 RepID=UPI002905A3DB|nr:DNA starvation/stationary phase protection protein [Roseobacter sp. HKCCA0434]